MPEFGENLSGREIDVLKCVADGASNKEVASLLDISPLTVKTHLRNIYAKLGAGSRTEAIRVGMEKGVLIAPNQTVNGNGVLAVKETAVPQINQTPIANELPSATVLSEPTPQRNWQILVLLGFAATILIGVFIWNQLNGSLLGEPISYTVEEMGNKWSVIREVSQSRPDMTTTAVGLALFQIGGSDADQPSNELIVIDTVESTVSQGTAKPTAVSNAAAVSWYGEIYVIGGEGEANEPLGIVEAFSPASNAWRPITSLPVPLSGALALANQDALYVIGGFDGETAVSTLFKFDLAEERWIELPEMPVARFNSAGGIIGDTLIVVGGENHDGILSSCSKFDLDNGTWLPCQELLTPRTKAEAVAFFGRLYLFGGRFGEVDNPILAEIYNNETDSWEQINTHSEFEQWSNWEGLGVNLVGDKIYISGGMINGRVSNDTFIFSPFPNRVYLPTTQNEKP